YISHDGINASLPRDLEPEELTLGQAVDLLAAQAAKGKSSGRGRPAKRALPKAAEKKSPAKVKAATTTKAAKPPTPKKTKDKGTKAPAKASKTSTAKKSARAAKLRA